MFDLNEQIIKWRSGLSESEKFSKADIDELETHLREEIENLTPGGLSQPEAFTIAKGRLGDTASLEEEFAKVNGGYMFRNRLFWMAAGAFAYMVAGCLSGTFGNTAVFIGNWAGLEAREAAAMSIGARAMGYGVTLVLACLACRPGSRLFRFSRFTGSRRGKIALFALLFAMVLALNGAAVLLRILLFKTMGIEYMERSVIVQQYGGLILWILVLMALLAVLIKLRMSRYRAARR